MVGADRHGTSQRLLRIIDTDGMDIPQSQPEQNSMLQFCVLDAELLQNPSVCYHIKQLGGGCFPFCDEALHAASRKKNGRRIVFLSAAFEGSRFKLAKAVSKEILGPMALARYATDTLPVLNRPLYSLAMEKVVAVVDGFSDAQTSVIVKQMHNMGALVVKKLKHLEVSRYPDRRRPTHLIVYSALCKSYEIAVDRGVIIATEEWPSELWRRRSDCSLHIRDADSADSILQRSLFQACFLRHIHFYLIAFSRTDRLRWIDRITATGGIIDKDLLPTTQVIVINLNCRKGLLVPVLGNSFRISTSSFYQAKQCHFEVRFTRLQSVPETETSRRIKVTFNSETQLFDVHDGQHIVDSKFLTAAFRNKIFPSLEQYSAIRDGDYSNSIKGRKRRLSLDPEPLVYSSPKRRLHRAAISSVMPLNITDTPARQLRSLALGSPSTDSPVPPQNAEKSNLDEHPTRDHQGSGVDLQVWPSKRFQRAMELLNTERNYAKVLRGLLDKVKPVLEGTNGPGTVLMSESQVNLVFGNLVQICRIHEEIIRELEDTIRPWRNSCEIGTTFLKHVFEIAKAYGLFVNSFEDAKQTVEECLAQKFKLKSVLKKALDLPEFGRQSLSDLLIRPVQRLPTLLLLLKDLRKYTEDGHPDSEGLLTAVTEFDRILQIINDGKRASDMQRLLRTIANDIQCAPTNLVSSARSFVMEIDVWETSSQQFTDRGGLLTLLLFNDSLEVCKKRCRNKSFRLDPSRLPGSCSAREKLYRHVMWIPMQRIHAVDDVDGLDERTDVFSLSFSREDVSCSCKFTATPECLEKKPVFVKAVHKCIEESTALEDTENEREDFSDAKLADGFNKRALEKARKLASRTSLRMSKAFSNLGARTNGSGLKRAASMMLFSPAKSVKTNPKPEEENAKE